MLSIRELRRGDLEPLRHFTDREIGAGYYSAAELDAIFERSRKDGTMYSLLLCDEGGAIQGVRFTYPPGQWSRGKGQGLNPALWPHEKSETGYFQSLFLAGKLQGQGWGGKLSREAIRLLRSAGAKGVVCHSWKESPNDSSTKYLAKLGFEKIADHPLYWKDVDYNCTRCLKPPCRCTATEMYLDLEKTK
jgi:predicted N-acetyltransferase YhbS